MGWRGGCGGTRLLGSSATARPRCPVDAVGGGGPLTRGAITLVGGFQNRTARAGVARRRGPGTRRGAVCERRPGRRDLSHRAGQDCGLRRPLSPARVRARAMVSSMSPVLCCSSSPPTTQSAPAASGRSCSARRSRLAPKPRAKAGKPASRRRRSGSRPRPRARRLLLAALFRGRRPRRCARAGQALGGTVIHPGDRWAICKDSEGSPFGLALGRIPGHPGRLRRALPAPRTPQRGLIGASAGGRIGLTKTPSEE